MSDPVAAKMPATAPLTASSSDASSKTMLGDLPPSSNVTRFRSPMAAWPTCAPTSTDPVNETLATRGSPTSARPVSAPPVTMFTTPAGTPASSSTRPNASVDALACSEGLTTIVQPAASAGASFHVSRSSGEFHAVMAAHTPAGSFSV